MVSFVQERENSGKDFIADFEINQALQATLDDDPSNILQKSPYQCVRSGLQFRSRLGTRVCVRLRSSAEKRDFCMPSVFVYAFGHLHG